MDIEKFDFDSLTDEQFNKFIWSLDALKARLNRVSVEELEREFEGKTFRRMSITSCRNLRSVNLWRRCLSGGLWAMGRSLFLLRRFKAMSIGFGLARR